MKYIIDIPDKAIDFMGGRDHVSVFVEPECKVGDCKHYALRLSKEDIEPYTEPDKEQIENEVWDFVSKFVWSFGDKEILGMGIAHAVRDMTYQEAKSKYDAWKKQKDKIRVGDEVVYHGNKYVVGYVGADQVYHIIDQNWIRVVVQGDYQIFKTGRHFPEVEELLKKMREEGEEE